MALQTKISACEKCCNRFDIFDKTGVYDSVNNPTGYGSPNATTSNILVETLTIQTPGLQSFTFNPFGTFPTINTSLAYIVLASQLGQAPGDNLQDGQYIISRISQGDFSGYFSVSTQETVIISCNVKCCIQKQLAKRKGGCKKNQDALDAYAKYQMMHAAIKCGQTEAALTILADLQQYCRTLGCNFC